MSERQFRLGQRVGVTDNAPRSNLPYVARYTITGLLPNDGRGAMYRVKGDGEAHERTMPEAILVAIF